MAEDDLESLAKQLAALQLEGEAIESNEWKILHNWAYKFRELHHLTATRFLREFCELPARPTFLTYLTKGHDVKPVGTAPSSVGGQLRSGIQKAMSKNITSVGPDAHLLENTVREYSDDLRAIAKASIFISCPPTPSSAGIMLDSPSVPEGTREELQLVVRSPHNDEVVHALRKFLADHQCVDVAITFDDSKRQPLFGPVCKNTRTAVGTVGGFGTGTVVQMPLSTTPFMLTL
jgi:hypothetical protein